MFGSLIIYQQIISSSVRHKCPDESSEVAKSHQLFFSSGAGLLHRAACMLTVLHFFFTSRYSGVNNEATLLGRQRLSRSKHLMITSFLRVDIKLCMPEDRTARSRTDESQCDKAPRGQHCAGLHYGIQSTLLCLVNNSKDRLQRTYVPTK